jgi:ribosomal protein S18 acetylase RimI-like enzyme
MDVGLEITAWRPELRSHFEQLNRVWLEGNDLLEELDLYYLQQPEEAILADGGQIFFALLGDQVVGTCAAKRVSGAAFELCKLGVAPEAQNRGIGRRLCEAVIAFAHASGAARVVLTSNQRLAPALRLYRALGFCDQPVPSDMPFVTVDVYMVLELGGAAT